MYGRLNQPVKCCPNCKSWMVRLHKTSRGKYYYECDGDCWTKTKLYWTEAEARQAWNNMKPEEKEETDG